MLQNGLYSLSFTASASGVAEKASGLAILRDGSILGSDPLGAAFSGTYEYDAERALNRVRLRLEIPSGGTLITGFESGSNGATLDVAGAFTGAADEASVFLHIAGAPLDVKIRYLGPLPN